jgi:hypothetical protein
MRLKDAHDLFRSWHFFLLEDAPKRLVHHLFRPGNESVQGFGQLLAFRRRLCL